MKVLVIQQKMIGDVLTSSILFEALRLKYPKAQLDYLINDHTAAVLENNPYIDNYVFFPEKAEQGIKGLIELAKTVRASKYDVLIDVYSKLSSNIISAFSGAKTKISYFKPYSTLIYHHNIKRYVKGNEKDGLAIINRMRLLEPIGIKDVFIKPKIYLKDKEIAEAKLHLKNNGIDPNKPLLMLNILGSGENKTYPIPYMVKIVDYISEFSKAQIIFNYLPNQIEEAKSILDLCSKTTRESVFFNVYGKGLREFLGITSQCTALIGNEGGAVNMAKALGIKTFTIFSPWIDKATWNLFQDEYNVSVHLKDYKPQLFSKPEKEYKKNALELYQKFKPEFFIDKLETFLTNPKDSQRTNWVEIEQKVLIKKNEMIKLSGVIITYNEEEHLEKCLSSLKGVVDEIIVVDSFSTDNTPEICKAHKVKFIQNSFEGYIEQKNFALSCANYDHILSLDGDEALSEPLKKSILMVKENWVYDGYFCNRLNNYCGQWIKHSDWYPDKKLRLFKKGSGEWKGINPHDTYTLKKGLKAGKLKGDLLHWIYRDYIEHNLKVERFSTIASEAYFKLGIKSSIFKIIFRPFWAFFKAYFLRLGFLDGLNGFIICVQTYNGTFLKYIKLYRLQNK